MTLQTEILVNQRFRGSSRDLHVVTRNILSHIDSRIDHELSIVFYDLTTIRTEGNLQMGSNELRQFGLAKEGDIARQVMLGVVQTADGLPIYHKVFAGNAAETRTLVPTIKKVLARYPIRRVVLVADRGLLSLDNLEAIEAIQVNDRPLEFILAVPARRYSDFDELLAEFHAGPCAGVAEEVVDLAPPPRRVVTKTAPPLQRNQSLTRKSVELGSTTCGACAR
nr:IS1634 family transposase [Burkholderia ubonensis]